MTPEEIHLEMTTIGDGVFAEIERDYHLGQAKAAIAARLT